MLIIYTFHNLCSQYWLLFIVNWIHLYGTVWVDHLNINKYNSICLYKREWFYLIGVLQSEGVLVRAMGLDATLSSGSEGAPTQGSDWQRRSVTDSSDQYWRVSDRITLKTRKLDTAPGKLRISHALRFGNVRETLHFPVTMTKILYSRHYKIQSSSLKIIFSPNIHNDGCYSRDKCLFYFYLFKRAF